MSTTDKFREGPEITFTAGAALEAFTRVKINTSGQVVAAGASEAHIGTLTDGVASGGLVSVRKRIPGGTTLMVCSAAVAIGSRVFATAAGKVDDGGTGRCIGRALRAGSGDGAIIEVLELDDPSPAGEAHTADDTLTEAESGSVHTSYGAAGTVVLTLPPAVKGLNYRFVVGAAQELRIDPDGAETISLPSTGVAGAAGKYLTANAAGESVELHCVQAGTWAVFGFTGTWTAEA